MLRIPEKLRDAVAIVLYAYHPDLITSAQIESATGTKEVARNVLSTGGNREYFHKVDDKYGLTFSGLHLVTKTIIPALSPDNKAEQVEEGSE